MTITNRRVPSWLWSVTDTKRKELLAKRNTATGGPLWTIAQLAPTEVLETPFNRLRDLAAAKLDLLAELTSGAPTSSGCACCGSPMGTERFEQVCETCHDGERVAS